MASSSVTVGVAGSGGDGVVALGSLLQRLAAWQGYFSHMLRFYGPQIRGGATAVRLSLDAEGVSLPKDSPDILVCFDWEKYLEVDREVPLAPETVVLYEKAPPSGLRLPKKSFEVDFSEASRQATGSDHNKNVVALGLVKRLLGLCGDRASEAIQTDEGLHLLKQNVAVLEAGELLLAGHSFAGLELCPAQDRSVKVVLHGNAAVAQGALRAGCRAFFGYPITPASEIMQEMQDKLPRLDGVFVQAEDEIAVMGLALGASIAGLKAMTATSGPGLDLMTEMMGLASAAEVPMVIVDVQRCGPSTGIPSKAEQSDLNHAIYGGHGEAPRVVMAPYDVPGCYRLLVEAINIAQRFQTLVIVLSDQWLGQGFVAVNDAFLKQDYPLEELKRPGGEETGDYRRYLMTDDFISPMAVAGEEGLTYQMTGLNHNEKGWPAFDFETNQQMHRKRYSKLMPLCGRDGLVEVFGNENCGRGILTWGSSAQIVLETVRWLGLQDEVKVCVPQLIHPLPERVERFVKSTDKLLVVEMNYSGQFYRYLRAQMDMPRKTELYARAGGRLFSRKELSGPVTEVAR
ncbi:MAG: hypothetical protein DRI39_04830 [Chloroflexi bacterium]|nr:MAG: hypothetical protein DRI39_04830 [Chloroflexota bacterium]